jgi:hypothetical protein
MVVSAIGVLQVVQLFLSVFNAGVLACGTFVVLFRKYQGDDDKRTAAQLVDKAGRGKLSDDEVKALKRAIHRWATWTVVSFVMAVLVALVAAGSVWSITPPQPLRPATISFTAIDPLARSDDPWLTRYPLFIVAASDLTQAASSANDGKSYELIKATTTPFGQGTGAPTIPFKCKVTYPHEDYKFSVYAMRASARQGEEAYLPLEIERSTGAVIVTVPGSATNDSLLLLGCLSKKTEGNVPADLKPIIRVELMEIKP